MGLGLRFPTKASVRQPCTFRFKNAEPAIAGAGSLSNRDFCFRPSRDGRSIHREYARDGSSLRWGPGSRLVPNFWILVLAATAKPQRASMRSCSGFAMSWKYRVADCQAGEWKGASRHGSVNLRSRTNRAVVRGSACRTSRSTDTRPLCRAIPFGLGPLGGGRARSPNRHTRRRGLTAPS